MATNIHFDLIAPFYERFIQPHQVERLAVLAGLPTPGWLLDAGGGTGRLSQLLSGLAKHVVVADLSLRMVQQAAKKDGLKAACSQAERLPFPDGQFSSIIMVDALHHVLDAHATLQELWRVLEPGGKIVIEEPNIRKWTVKVVALIEKLLLMRSHFYPPKQITEMVAGNSARTRIELDGYTSWVIIEKALD